MLAEDRLELAVESAALGVGEYVMVVTLMGNEVARGDITAIYPTTGAVQIRDVPSSDAEFRGARGDRIYDPAWYRFVPVEPAPAREDHDTGVEYDDPGDSIDEHPDRRAQAKIAEAKGGEKESIRTDTSTPGTSVDVDKLPPAVKKSLVGVQKMDEEQVNKVLSEIGSAALRSLRNVGVKDTDVYRTVVKIQDAVKGVMGDGGK